MIRFLGRLIIKTITCLISLGLGLVELVFYIALELATKVLSFVLLPAAILIVFQLILKNTQAAGIMAILVGVPYLIVFLGAFLMVNIGFIREFFEEISHRPLFHRW